MLRLNGSKDMKCIEEKVLNDGIVINNSIIKVDSFLNHQVDPKVIDAFAREVKKEFGNQHVNLVLTIETSGIAVAYAVAQVFEVPLLFAKKTTSATTVDDYYKAKIKSFTRNCVADVIVSKKFIKPRMNVLIVDDFLAEGNAALGLTKICHDAGSNVIGVAAVIEKIFQGGRGKLEEIGIKVVAGASIKALENNKPIF